MMIRDIEQPGQAERTRERAALGDAPLTPEEHRWLVQYLKNHIRSLQISSKRARRAGYPDRAADLVDTCRRLWRCAATLDHTHPPLLVLTTKGTGPEFSESLASENSGRMPHLNLTRDRLRTQEPPMSSGDTTPAKLTARQLQAIAALAGGATFDEAAVACGSNRRTVLRWNQNPLFQEVLTAEKVRLFQASAAALIAAVPAAVAHLLETMRDPTANRPTRLRAAGLIIENGFKAHQIQQTEERLAELEATVQQLLTHQGRKTHV